MSVFFFSSRRRHTRCSRDWSSDVCSSDWLHDDHLDVLVLHLLDDPHKMARRCGDPWAILERRGLNQAEARQEIDPLRMVDDDLAAPNRLHHLQPPRHLTVEPAEERLTVPLESLSM